jgi:hypothetical protein
MQIVSIFAEEFNHKQIKINHMTNTLNQSQPIYWRGTLCKFIKWETLNFGGKLKIKINKKFIEVSLKELTN